MKLLTALGLSAALLLSAQPAAALNAQKLGTTAIQSAVPTNHCGVVRWGDPPCQHIYISNPSLLACMGFSLPTTDFQRYLYCINLLNSTLTPTPVPKPIATPAPTPEPRNPECSSMADSLYFEETTSRKTQIWRFVKPDRDVVREEMWCYGFAITWVIRYKNGTTRKVSDTLDSDNEASYELYRASKVRSIRVSYEYQPGSQGGSLTCSPKTKTCNTAPDKPSSPGCLACGDTW
jgi:hypothetical protein